MVTLFLNSGTPAIMRLCYFQNVIKKIAEGLALLANRHMRLFNWTHTPDIDHLPTIHSPLPANGDMYWSSVHPILVPTASLTASHHFVAAACQHLKRENQQLSDLLISSYVYIYSIYRGRLFRFWKVDFISTNVSKLWDSTPHFIPNMCVSKARVILASGFFYTWNPSTESFQRLMFI